MPGPAKDASLTGRMNAAERRLVALALTRSSREKPAATVPAASVGWSEAEDARLRALWPDMTLTEGKIAHRLNRTKGDTALRAAELGLVRSPRKRLAQGEGHCPRCQILMQYAAGCPIEGCARFDRREIEAIPRTLAGVASYG
jgi:hypothetical protein